MRPGDLFAPDRPARRQPRLRPHRPRAGLKPAGDGGSEWSLTATSPPTCWPATRTPTASATRTSGTSTPSRLGGDARRSSSRPGRCWRAGWRRTTAEEKKDLAAGVQKLLTSAPAGRRKRRTRPSIASWRRSAARCSAGSPRAGGDRSHARPRRDASAVGLDPALFGKHPGGSPIDAASLCVQAPSRRRGPPAGRPVAGCGVRHDGHASPTGGRAASSSRVTTASRRRDRPACGPTAPASSSHDGSAAQDGARRAFDDFRRCSRRRCATRRSSRSTRSSR